MTEASGSDAEAYKTSRQATNKITYKITMIAQERCKQVIEDYNLCAKGRSISMLWACREKYNQSQDCVHQFLNDRTLDIVKRRWIDAGRPHKPDWDQLLEGLGPDMK